MSDGSSGFRLRHGPPVWSHGRIRVDVQVYFDGKPVDAMRVALNDDRDRLRFAKRVQERLDGRAPGLDELEERLLNLLHKATRPDNEAGDAGDSGDAEIAADRADDDDELLPDDDGGRSGS